MVEKEKEQIWALSARHVMAAASLGGLLQCGDGGEHVREQGEVLTTVHSKSNNVTILSMSLLR